MSTDLSNNSGADESAVTTISNLPELREIPLEKIRPSHCWYRSDYEKNIPSLAASIQKHGLQQFPTVADTKDGYYELISGHQRYFAHKHIGRKTLVCCILNIDLTDAGVLSFVDNNKRNAMHPVDIAENLKQIMTEKNWTYAKLAEEIDWPQSSVTEYLDILDLDKDILDTIEDGTESGLSFTHAVVLSRLKHSPRPNREIEMRQLQNKTIKYKLSAAELKRLVKMFTEGRFDLLRDNLRTYLLTSKAMTADMAELYLSPESVIAGQDEKTDELRKIAERLDKKQLADLIIKAVDGGWGYEITREKLLDLIRRQRDSAADGTGQTKSAYDAVMSNISELLGRVKPAYNEALELAKSNPEQLTGLCQSLEQLLARVTPLIESIKNMVAQN